MADENPKPKLDRRGRRVGNRGARPGGTQQPYEPTERDREYVREHANYAPLETIARRLGVSAKTVQRHFQKELAESKEDFGIDLARTAAEKALAGDGPMLRFLLATRFGWNTKVRHEHTGAGGGPIRTIDVGPLIDGKSEDELAELERILEALAAEADQGEPGGDQGGFGPSEGEAAGT